MREWVRFVVGGVVHALVVINGLEVGDLAGNGPHLLAALTLAEGRLCFLHWQINNKINQHILSLRVPYMQHENGIIKA